MSNRNIAFVAYETPSAPCGGIAAVLGKLPGFVSSTTGRNVIVIAPFHHRLERMAALLPKMQKVGEVGIPSGKNMVMVELLRHDQQWPWYYLRAEDPRYFAGARHPYDIDAASLLRDSLFFGAAVLRVMRIIAGQDAWSLALQDWEAATAALAFAGQQHPHKLFVTLHNSYDCDVGEAELTRVAIDPGQCPGGSVLQRALPRVERPVFTVSDQFALDFSEDQLQRQIMTSHLQELLRGRLIGVNNGPFIDCAVGAADVAAAARGNHRALEAWKRKKRREATAALEALVPSPEQPVWGDVARFRKGDVPWFVMAGRDDSRQKGYDIAAGAIERFLTQGADARFLFFPIPGDEGHAGLGFMKHLAERFPDRVLVLPFRFREGYFAALAGANFGIMPSLYEPFGMANEFYLNGTLAIGRATGGLLQQIVPWRAAASFGHGVQIRADRWHVTSSHPTGILFRERDGIESAVADWQSLNAARYSVTGGAPDRVSERLQYPLFQAMVEELRLALSDAVQLVHDQPELYFRMLAEGVTYIQRNFSWQRAAQEYVRNME